MSEDSPRLGDLVDDYCSRCRLILNHGVMGLVSGKIKRVRCNTCLTEHDFKRGKIPRRKDKVRELFDEVLSSMPNQPAPAAPTQKPQPEIARRRSHHLAVSQRMAELRAKHEAEEEARQKARKNEPGGRRRRRGGRGRGGGGGGGRGGEGRGRR